MGNALDDIRAERRRQIDEEGFCADHDDRHGDGSLATAAACYAAGEVIYVRREWAHSTEFRKAWPWTRPPSKNEKLTYPRALVVAGALIVAELERLDRAAAKP